jgi:predicted regulator of Ras-like GTPase activity (Roadblock/LC7/MglB family)
VSLNNITLHEPEFQRIKAILGKMQKELRAEVVLLISRSGQPMVVSGTANNIDYTALATLAAANLAATDGLANLIGEKEFSVLLHQGRRRSLYISDLLKQYSLVVVFDASTSLGLVRYRSKRTTTLLEAVIRDVKRRAEKIQPAQERPNFTDEELEQLLGQ